MHVRDCGEKLALPRMARRLRQAEPSLQALSARELTRRVRPLSKDELQKLDF